MQLSVLNEFIDLSKDVNFSACARRMNLSVSALSTHMNALEREVGATLVKRGSRRSLTAEGKAFLAYACKIVDLYNEAKLECQRISQQIGGVVKIDSHIGYSDAADMFFRMMVAFREANPGVKLQMTRDSENSIIDALATGAVDLGLVAAVGEGTEEWLAERGVSCICLMEEPTSVWIAASSPAARGAAVSIKELSALNLNLRVRCDSRYDTWKQAYDRLFSKVGARTRYSVTCAETEGEYLLADVAPSDISLGPDSIFKRSRTVKIHDDRVVKPIEPPVLSRAYACFRADDDNSALRALITWLQQNATK